MFDLQTALDERLAVLNNKKIVSKQSVSINDVSKEYIQNPLNKLGS
jgi:hypothetical protein